MFALASSFTSSMVVAAQVRFSRLARARSYRSLRRASSCAGIAVSSSSRETKTFSRVSRRTSTHWFFSRSLGPISRRRGTPFISHWENFQPGALSLSSSFTRAYLLIFSASSAAFSETPGLWAAMGTTTT